MSSNIRFAPFRDNHRIVSCEIPEDRQRKFFESSGSLSTKFLSRVSQRQRLLDYFIDAIGENACEQMKQSVRHREHGALLVRWINPDETSELQRVKHWIRAACALGELLGELNLSFPQFQPADSLYFVHIPDEKFTLAKASGYRPEFLHTDGYVSERREDHYLVLTVCRLENWIGGNSTILHLDDWEDVACFRDSPYARMNVRVVADRKKNTSVSREELLDPAKLDDLEVESTPVFYSHKKERCFRFVGEYMHGKTDSHQAWLDSIAVSLNQSRNIVRFRFEPGMALALNNLFWLHGRDACAVHPKVSRLLYRVRGQFRDGSKG